MKLKNKKTGEIRELPDGFFCGDNLKKICEEWEDYEEPTGYWYIDFDGDVLGWAGEDDEETDRKRQAIGNYFETEEEAEKAVEKLKAWKRLKDKNFKVDLWDYDGSDGQGRIRTGRILFRVKDYEENDKDLDLLFGGEE